jgi:hypothetical protein
MNEKREDHRVEGPLRDQGRADPEARAEKPRMRMKMFATNRLEKSV